MNISEKNHSSLFNILLAVIAATLIFRIPSTIVIGLFTAYNLLNLKKLNYKGVNPIPAIILTSPFIIHLMFFWNDAPFYNAFKAVEKYSSLIILPLFIIGNSRFIDFKRLLKRYSFIFTLILVVFFIRYIIVYPELFFKYQKGIEVWEMGYSFANSMGTHAPALNMHIAFVLLSVSYLISGNLSASTVDRPALIQNLLLFAVLLYFLLYVNTRLALVAALLSLLFILIVHFLETRKRRFSPKPLSYLSLFTLVGLSLFVYKNPYMFEKYTTVTFSNMDKVGRLDEIENVQAVACNAFVTRVSIWKSTFELINKKPLIGHGSSTGKQALFDYYEETNQRFLAYNRFPVHNQILDFTLKFGFFGFFIALAYLTFGFWLSWKMKNVLVFSFALLFFLSNQTDDFLIRYDGIAFSGFWLSVFYGKYINASNPQDVKNEEDK